MAKNIKSTGAFTETSKYVAREITRYISIEHPQVIVELGAGNGNVTKAILHKMHPKSLLLSFELNADFCNNIKNHLIDNRLTIINDSAENFDQYLLNRYADVIISTLPFTIFPQNMAHTILKKIKIHMTQSGHFSQAYYSLFFLKVLKKYFKENKIRLRANFPPAFIIHSAN